MLSIPFGKNRGRRSIADLWKGAGKMEYKNNKGTPTKRTSGENLYDDHNIPEEDLPLDIIPDEVPRRDGPGGEPSDSSKNKYE